jgi:uncharacterized protein YdhG (YjbR/CyaY superfamily)
MAKVAGFTQVHKKAIEHYLNENPGVRLVAPSAYPQVTFMLEDGTLETKEIIHVVSAHEAYKRSNKSKRKADK